MKTDQRERTVDFLKGICILLVCFTHFQWTGEQVKKFLFPFWVDMAVPVFMILSGYIYTKVSDQRASTVLSQAYRPSVLCSKLIRLTVPVLLTYAVTLLWDYYQHQTIEYPIFFTFLQGGRGQGAYYYPVMVQTVFVLPLIHAAIKRFEEKGLFLCFFINAAYEVLHVAYLIPTESYRLLMFRYIFVLAAGSFLATGKRWSTKYWITMLFVGASFIFSYSYGGYKPLFVKDWTGTCFIASMYAVPFAWIVICKIKPCFSPLEWVGKASYHIFLAQMLYYYCFSPFVYQGVSNRKLQLLICMTISVGLGLLFYIVESPLTKWLQNKTKCFFKERHI